MFKLTKDQWSTLHFKWVPKIMSIRSCTLTARLHDYTGKKAMPTIFGTFEEQQAALIEEKLDRLRELTESAFAGFVGGPAMTMLDNTVKRLEELVERCPPLSEED